VSGVIRKRCGLTKGLRKGKYVEERGKSGDLSGG